MHSSDDRRAIARYKKQIVLSQVFVVLSVMFIIAVGAIFYDTNISRFFSKFNTDENNVTVNVVFADYPSPWSDTYVRGAIADPLVLLHNRYKPRALASLNVIVYAYGIPLALRQKNAVAMFSPEDDVILVDGDLFKKLHSNDGGGPLSIQNTIIAHEGMHLIQDNKGVFSKGLHRTNDYFRNPVEIEAMIEGVTVANALDPENPFGMPFGPTIIKPRIPLDYPDSPSEYSLHYETRSTASKWLRRFFPL